ncbi:MAG: hypothetical protein KDK25_06465 [Leptospiraceae bacterium]|nr:hypothetical protein [Leptospiraceae bacterium]
MKVGLIAALVLSLVANAYLGTRFFLEHQTEQSRDINAALRTLQDRNKDGDSRAGPSDQPDASVSAADFSGRQTLPPAGYANLLLKNVRFYWTDAIFADVELANATLKSSSADGLVDFDAPQQLEIHLQRARVGMDYSVLEGMMNGPVFGHGTSHVRNMKMDSIPDPDGPGSLLRIRGELELITWLDFEMLASVQAGQNRDLLVKAQQIESLGLPFVKGLMGSVGLELESLIVPAKGSGVFVQGNTIRISLPEFFPSPRVVADVESVDVQDKGLLIAMKGKAASAADMRRLPDPSARHYLYAAGRFVKFGPLRLIATSLQMIDTSPEDPFHFHMQKYFRQLDRSRARVQLDGRVRVWLLDYDKL